MKKARIKRVNRRIMNGKSATLFGQKRLAYLDFPQLTSLLKGALKSKRNKSS